MSIKSIPLSKTDFCPWQKDRPRECKTEWKDNSCKLLYCVCPIEVTYYEDKDNYFIDNGNHRCFRRFVEGHDTIDAIVENHTEILGPKEKEYFMNGNHLFYNRLLNCKESNGDTKKYFLMQLPKEKILDMIHQLCSYYEIDELDEEKIELICIDEVYYDEFIGNLLENRLYALYNLRTLKATFDSCFIN